MKRFALFVLTLALLLTIRSAHAESDFAMQSIFKNLMTATVTNDRDKFVADCDDTMKAAITPEKLASVSKLIEPRAKGGYDSDYLGELNQRGYAVHLWRLRFKDGGDDILATLSLKDGKVGGFFLR